MSYFVVDGKEYGDPNSPIHRPVMPDWERDELFDEMTDYYYPKEMP